MTYQLKPWLAHLMWLTITAATAARLLSAIQSFSRADKTSFLAFPLTVLIPLLAFAFLATRRKLRSQEGVLMQLGCLIQLFFIIALPGLALYLALGFPVVFLVVKMFETRAPEPLRSWLKARLITC